MAHARAPRPSALATEFARTRHALYDLIAGRGADAALARCLGLSERAARALSWVSQPVAGGRPWIFELGFAGDCPGTALPREVFSVRGARLPVRSVRGTAHGHAHLGMQAGNYTHHFLDGALGAILRMQNDPQRLCALTAGHVVGAAPGSCHGDRIRFQTAGHVFFGRLLEWQPNFEPMPGTTTLDAGRAEVDLVSLEPLLADPADWPTGSSSVFDGDSLQLRTLRGVIAGGNVSFTGALLALNGDHSRAYFVRDAIGWQTASPTMAGDSGAPVWNNSEELVGIHAGGQYGGLPNSALAIPIGPILNWADCDVVRRGEPLQRQAPPAVSSQASFAVPVGMPAQSGPADVLARTMYGEARGDGAEGMAAIAQVVLNRVAANSWWGRDVASVCNKPWQFSCWNLNDPNRAKLLTATAADPSLQLAFEKAQELLAMDTALRSQSDPTHGATHYYARNLVPPPRWAQGKSPCAVIGRHIFFKGIA